MTAITCPHSYQSTRLIAGERDAFRIRAEHRLIPSYRCELLNAIAATSQSYRLNFSDRARYLDARG